jgi:hypothetical protein
MVAKSVVNFWQMVAGFGRFMPVIANSTDVKKPPSPYEVGVWRFLPAFAGLNPGAACRNRTGDLFITNELLYQLS